MMKSETRNKTVCLCRRRMNDMMGTNNEGEREDRVQNPHGTFLAGLIKRSIY